MRRYIVNPDGTIKWLDKPKVVEIDGKKHKPASGWKKLAKPTNKAHGGKISKYYKGGGNVITGRD